METSQIVLSKYEAYKDSGESWLGEIPSDWVVTPNKHIFDLKKSQVGKHSSKYDLLSLTLQGIIKRNLEDGGKFPAEFDTYQEVNKGDFVFCFFDVEETPRTVGLSDFDGMITGAYTVMRPRNGFHSGYLFYFYLNLDSKKRLRFLYKGLRNTIPKESFFSLKSLIPPLPEQTAIAAFLDEKTAKIDQAIAQKERLIELLKERKQILIQELVTGKKVWDEATQSWVKPTETVDSGVEWIGEIPKGWEVKKFKFIIKTKARLGWKGLKAHEYLENSDFLLLSTPNIKGKEIDFDNAYFISAYRYYESPEIMLEKGDVLLVKDGSTLGITNIVNKLPSFSTVNSSIAVLRVMNKKILLSEYLNLFIQSRTLQDLIEKKKDGMGVPHLFQSDINNFSVPIFDIEYQEKIVQKINNESKKIDNSISINQSQITQLKEYKSVLIDSAVTGKIKVPGV